MSGVGSIRILAFWDPQKQTIDRKVLLGLMGFALLLRLPLLFFPEIIHNDGIEYIRHAKLILAGDWSGGKAPPLYPALIALSNLFIPDAERAGILISVLFGTLLVLPVVYLGKEIYDARVGVLSGLIVAVHPWLYTSSGSVLTESTYYFFAASVVLMGWYAFKGGRIYEVILVSLSASLVYLVKPEGLGFLVVFSLWVLIVRPSGEKRSWMKRFGMVFLSVFCFFLFVSPYLMQIHKDTGRWAITKKIKISVESPSQEDGASSLEIRKTRQIHLLSFMKHPLVVLEMVFLGFFQSLYKFQQGYHPILFLLALLGLVWYRDSSFSRKGNLYLLAYFVFFLGCILPFFWVTRRYTSQMIPLAIPLGAFGFLKATEWVSRRTRQEGFFKKIPVVSLFILLIVLFVQGRVSHSRNFRLIQKEVGFWMKDHLQEGGKIMSKFPQEAYYSGMTWTLMPNGSYDTILKEAYAKEVRYLVVDESIERDSSDFIEKSKEGVLMKRYHLEMDRRWMTVFELVGSSR